MTERLISMSKDYFTTGAAMADRLTEIAAQLRTVGDVHETFMGVEFQVVGNGDATLGSPQRLATFGLLADALGLTCEDSVYDDSDHYRRAGSMGLKVYGRLPKPIKVRREELLAQLAALDAQLACPTQDDHTTAGYGVDPDLTDSAVRAFGDLGTVTAEPERVSDERVAEILAEANSRYFGETPNEDGAYIRSLSELDRTSIPADGLGFTSFRLVDGTHFSWSGPLLMWEVTR